MSKASDRGGGVVQRDDARRAWICERCDRVVLSDFVARLLNEEPPSHHLCLDLHTKADLPVFSAATTSPAHWQPAGVLPYDTGEEDS